MLFCEKLNEYIASAGCSSKDVCVRSGISAPTLSRYRSGERIPEADSEAFGSLCKALSALLNEKGEPTSPDKIYNGFMACENITLFDRSQFSEKLGALIAELNISPAQIGKYTHYDESSVFRFKNATRRPSDPIKFASDAAQCVAENVRENDIQAIGDLTGRTEDELLQQNGVYAAVKEWLLESEPEIGNKKGGMSEFLKKLDSFDLNEYIKAIRFDEIKIPTMPFSLPTSKYYYGVRQMMACELDFLKATVLSKSMKEVTMYSDMPMTEMAKDKVFAKKWMTGLAIMLKKGLTLNQIHDLNRPFDEMMLGLEGWIPMYMTGQIRPFYFENAGSEVFNRIFRISGAAALSGEAISGSQPDGRYYLSKTKEDIAYYTKFADGMLKKAKPLMEIYRADNISGFSEFLSQSAETAGTRRNILSSPPLYAIDGELLDEILTLNSADPDLSAEIKKYCRRQKDTIESILRSSQVCDEVSVITKADFEAYPMRLPLSDIFCAHDIKYTYDQYLRHMEQCEAFARSHENYTFIRNTQYTFRNLQIHICKDNFAHISKTNAPAVHFVIRHPKLTDALMNYTNAPIKD